MWSMGALLLLCALLWPLARHADRRGRPGLLHGAALRLWQLPVSVLAALAAVFVGSALRGRDLPGTDTASTTAVSTDDGGSGYAPLDASRL